MGEERSLQINAAVQLARQAEIQRLDLTGPAGLLKGTVAVSV
jgi:hypothetical protein